jgi:hypothetical protein
MWYSSASSFSRPSRAAYHDGYPAHHDRRVIYVRSEPSYWLISDSLAGEGFVWRLHGRDEGLLEGTGFRAAAAPGLLVLPADPARVQRVEYHTSPARIPDAARRQAEYGLIHGLCLHLAGGQSDVLLLPFASDPGRAGVTRDGATIVVHVGGFEDRRRHRGGGGGSHGVVAARPGGRQ